MISVEFSTLIALSLDLLVFISFVLYILDNQAFLKKEKKIDLIKKECEICGFSSFLNSKGGYWRCPDCESLNKE